MGTSIMELAHLLLTPATLLTAFIFFWNQAKTGREELKRELNTDIGELKVEIMSVRREVATVRDELKVDIREEIAPIRAEMHDMNGRLGRVEGLLRTSDAG